MKFSKFLLFVNISLVQRSIFLLGLIFLVISLTYPLFGALSNRDVPVEIDDSSAYIQRGIQMAICPLQDCKALEDLRPVLEKVSQDQETAFNRRDIFTRVIQNHIPLYSIVMSLFYDDNIGIGFYKIYYGLQALTALLLVLGLSGYFLVQFGTVPAGIACMLVGATYFAGQGLINLVPVTLGWGIPLIAIALLIKFENRFLPIIALLLLIAMGSHIIAKVYVLVFLAFYVFRSSRPNSISDYTSLLIIIIGVVFFFLLPYLFQRPSFDNPASANVIVNILEGIKENVINSPRIIERTTKMLGGIIPMSMICIISAMHLIGQKRKDFILLFGLLGGIAFISLFHVHSNYPADLFARTWIPFAILMTGACAYLFWTLLITIIKNMNSEVEIKNTLENRANYVLAPTEWAKLGLILATLTIGLGFGYQLAQGLYAIQRAKIMYTHRQDFTQNNEQIKIITKDCNRVLYMHKDAMLSYFSIGGLKCGAIYRLAYNNEEWAKAFEKNSTNINYAVTMNQMGQWKGWQPIGFANPAKISFWPNTQLKTLRMRLKNKGISAKIELKDGEQTITANINGFSTSWITFDTKKINPKKTYDIITSTSQIELGGLRLDNESNLYWPWDQGVILSYHRNIPYQFASDITFRFDSSEIFPIDLDFEIINDHEATVLGKVK